VNENNGSDDESSDNEPPTKQQKSEWRVVLRTQEEKRDALHSMHSSPQGI